MNYIWCFTKFVLLHDGNYRYWVVDKLQAYKRFSGEVRYVCQSYTPAIMYSSVLTLCLRRRFVVMRPSSLGGGRIMRRTLSVRLSVCSSVPLWLLPSVTSRVAPPGELQWHTHRGPHNVRPSRPHKLVNNSFSLATFYAFSFLVACQCFTIRLFLPLV